MKRLSFCSICVVLGFALAGCHQSSDAPAAALASMDPHQQIQIVDPALGGSSQSAGTVSAQSIVTIGSVYLETQLPPLSVDGVVLQGADVFTKNMDSYVSYALVNALGVEKGAVVHYNATNCTPNGSLRTQYCLRAQSSLGFTNANIYASYSDGGSLYAVGSTTDESQAPKYARLFKLPLDANGDVSTVSTTVALASYAGTGITGVGTNLIVTTGTSTDVTKQGGFSVLDSGLNVTASQTIYDARAVQVDPSNTAKVIVSRGALSPSSTGALLAYPADGSGSGPTQTYASGGNTIADSKSTLQVGHTLVVSSAGDQGFKVMCKASGASLATVAAPVVAGIPTGLTVTNSVLAIPGYILAANGEAGIYLYSFQKSNPLNSSYCQGVLVTLVGRMSLSTNTTYVNGELSANSLSYMPVYNVANALVSKLLVVGSGNKGVSLINLSALNVSATDVNDF